MILLRSSFCSSKRKELRIDVKINCLPTQFVSDFINRLIFACCCRIAIAKCTPKPVDSFLHAVCGHYLCVQGKEEWRKRHDKCTSDKWWDWGDDNIRRHHRRSIERVDNANRVACIECNAEVGVNGEGAGGSVADIVNIAMNTNDIVVAVLILIPLDSITRARRMHYSSSFVFPMLMSLGFNIASAFKLFRVRVVRNTHRHKCSQDAIYIWHSSILASGIFGSVHAKWRMCAH